MKVGYKEEDNRLKEQLINDMNDDEIMTELIRKLMTAIKTRKITSVQVLACTRKVKAQRTQKTLIITTKRNIEFDAVERRENRKSVTDKTR